MPGERKPCGCGTPDCPGPYVHDPKSRCLGCRAPSGERCGGCGAFIDDGWDGKLPSDSGANEPSGDKPRPNPDSVVVVPTTGEGER